MGFIVSQSSTMAPKAIMDGRLLSPRWAEIRSSQRSHPRIAARCPGPVDKLRPCIESDAVAGATCRLRGDIAAASNR